MTDAKTPPHHRIRLKPLTASIWMREGKYGLTFSVMLSRTYRDDESQAFRRTTLLREQDLLAAAKLLDRVHSYCDAERERAKNDSRNG